MKIEIVDSIEKLISYKEEWESILKEMNNDIVFLELDWITSWWGFFGNKHKLFVLIIINDQGVVGICPLIMTNKGIYNEISFAGSKESGTMDFILKNKFREEALECICNFLRNLKGKNIIQFHGISVNSINYSLLEKYLKVNKVPFTTSSLIRYFLNFKNNDFNTHFENRFGKKTRQTMNNKEKKLRRLGILAFKKITSSEIDEVFEIHDKRWLRKIGNSSFSKGGTKEFYKELASNKNMKFNITVDAITLNNKIISFMYGLEYNGRYLFIRIAHDDDFCFLSPGELVFKKKMEECFLSQIRVFDFGLGYEPYKAKWSDHYEEVFNVIFPSNNLKSNFIFYIKYWTRIKLKNALKKNKRIYNFRKYSLGKIKFLLSRVYISNKILKIKRAINQNGLLIYLLKHFNDLSSRIFSRKKHLILEKDIEWVEISQNNMQIKEATIDDLDPLSEAMNESSNKIIRRFTNKHKCYITLYNSQIIHYCWINCSNVEISNIEIKIPFGKLYVHIYDVFMEKKYKNEYNYTCILSNIFNLLYKENFRKCYITLDTWNKSFENEIYKKIFQPSYKVLEKRIFNIIKHSIVDLKLIDKG